MSAELVRRVERSATALDYRHNLAASNLRRGVRTSSIGVLLHDLSNPFSATLLRAIDDRARERRIAVLSASLDTDVEREPQLARDLVSRRVDGLVLMPAAPSQDYLYPEVRAGLHVVAVDRPLGGLSADTVLADNDGGTRAAVAHLVRSGHRRIACLTGSTGLWTATRRREAFCDVVTADGELDDRLVCSGIGGVTEAERAVTQLLDLDDPPTALFTGQNEITIGARRALSRLGLTARIAMVGFDDFPLADLLDPAVSVIRQDVAAMGGHVADLLLARLDGASGPPRRVVVPTTLVARGSGEIVPAEFAR